MFSQAMLGVNDIEISKISYDAVLDNLGIGPGFAKKHRNVYTSPVGFFVITTPINREPATHGNGATIGFNVDSPEQTNTFYAAGIANSGTACEGPPELRASGAYLAYLRDPDGNKVCAIHRPG